MQVSCMVVHNYQTLEKGNDELLLPDSPSIPAVFAEAATALFYLPPHIATSLTCGTAPAWLCGGICLHLCSIP